VIFETMLPLQLPVDQPLFTGMGIFLKIEIQTK